MELNLKNDKLNKLNSYNKDKKYDLIYTKLENYFKNKTDISSGYFDNTASFLSNDKILKKILLNKNLDECNTPQSFSIFHEILFDLNENKENLSSFKVNYENFFQRITQELLFSYDLKERSQGLINQYKAHEMKSIIEQNKQKIKHRGESFCKFNSGNSKFFFILKNVTNFPIGNYIVESEILELGDKESDRETTYSGKTASSIFENKKTFFIDKKIIVDKDMSFVDLVNKREKDYYKSEDFEFKKFLVEDRDFKITNYSGTSLHKLSLNFYKDNGEILGNFSKNFIVLLLMNIEKISDIMHEDININLVTRLDTEDPKNDFRMELEFFFKFDSQARSAILENVYKILCNVIDMNTIYHNNVCEILSYFLDIRERIEGILSEPNEEKKDNCACTCNIL